MDRPVESQKRKRHAERVTLNETSLTKLNAWLCQIENQNKGININKNSLINWLLNELPAQLSLKQLNELQAQYLDPVKQAKEALREARAAKARGEKFVLKIEMDHVDDLPRPKRVYKKKEANPELPLTLKEQRVIEESHDLEAT